jgi:Flp pilus assembly protein TadD
MLALFARSQSENSRVTALLRDGQSALDAGDFSRAVQDFENARQLAPDNAEINRGLVLSYLLEITFYVTH